MASLLATHIPGSYPYMQDIKYAERVEDAQHVEDVQLHDIYVDPSSNVPSLQKGHGEPPASLLTIPVEIRLRIYEMAYDATFIHTKLEWERGLELQLHGTSETDSPSIRLAGSPFTLPRVCRRLYYEVSPMLPPISRVALQFNDFTEDDMQRWLQSLSDFQIAQMRSFKMTGWNSCRLKYPLCVGGHRLNCHRYQRYVAHATNGLCDRSLALDLNAFERQFHAERFEKMVSGAPLGVGSAASYREFHKACYLLRVLDGCVSRPAPRAHPVGRNPQCGTWDVVEAAVASFVGDAGDVAVTRGKIVGLLRAAMGDYAEEV